MYLFVYFNEGDEKIDLALNFLAIFPKYVQNKI